MPLKPRESGRSCLYERTGPVFGSWIHYALSGLPAAVCYDAVVAFKSNSNEEIGIKLFFEKGDPKRGIERMFEQGVLASDIKINGKWCLDWTSDPKFCAQDDGFDVLDWSATPALCLKFFWIVSLEKYGVSSECHDWKSVWAVCMAADIFRTYEDKRPEQVHPNISSLVFIHEPKVHAAELARQDHVQIEAKQFERALFYYKRVYMLSPNFKNLYYVSKCLIQLHRFKEALNPFKELAGCAEFPGTLGVVKKLVIVGDVERKVNQLYDAKNWDQAKKGYMMLGHYYSNHYEKSELRDQCINRFKVLYLMCCAHQEKDKKAYKEFIGYMANILRLMTSECQDLLPQCRSMIEEIGYEEIIFMLVPDRYFPELKLFCRQYANKRLLGKVKDQSGGSGKKPVGRLAVNCLKMWAREPNILFEDRAEHKVNHIDFFDLVAKCRVCLDHVQLLKVGPLSDLIDVSHQAEAVEAMGSLPLVVGRLIIEALTLGLYDDALTLNAQYSLLGDVGPCMPLLLADQHRVFYDQIKEDVTRVYAGKDYKKAASGYAILVDIFSVFVDRELDVRVPQLACLLELDRSEAVRLFVKWSLIGLRNRDSQDYERAFLYLRVYRDCLRSGGLSKHACLLLTEVLRPVIKKYVPSSALHCLRAGNIEAATNEDKETARACVILLCAVGVERGYRYAFDMIAKQGDVAFQDMLIPASRQHECYILVEFALLIRIARNHEVNRDHAESAKTYVEALEFCDNPKIMDAAEWDCGRTGFVEKWKIFLQKKLAKYNKRAGASMASFTMFSNDAPGEGGSPATNP